MKKQIALIKPTLQKGFTLIELMIVITIIGILATFAVPMFQDYTIRTRVGEGLILASSAKNLVVDNAVNGFRLDNGWDGIESTANTASITVDEESGVITITSDNARAAGVILLLTPSAPRQNGNANVMLSSGEIPVSRIAWKCSVSYANKVKESYIPAECRSTPGN